MGNDAPLSRVEARDGTGMPIRSVPDCSEGLTLAEMVRRYRVTPRAMRFYEAKRLLTPQRRSGERFYGHTEQERLALLLHAKALGFTLSEIGPMLATPPAEICALNITRRQCFEQIQLLEKRKRETELALTELRRVYSSFYARIAHSRV
jgi:DNA-binding transcriptional MerR regulator